jgi:hypothetical protein
VKKLAVSLYDRNGQPAATFNSIDREGDKLVMEAKALEVMDVEVVMTPSSFFKMIPMVVSWPVISFILLLPYFGLKRLFKR